MSRKVWIAAGVTVALLLVLAAGGAAGIYFYFIWADHVLLARVAEAAGAQDWRAVKNNCAWYLTRHQRDTEILGKYADACSRILADRNANVRETNRAYFQLASLQPQNDDLVARVLDFQDKHRLWVEMEYSSSYFIRQRSEGASAGSSSGLGGRLRYCHALALDRMGRTKEAIDGYTDLTSSGTTFIDAYGNLARLLDQEGLAEQAQIVLKQAEERFPDHSHVYLFRARLALARRSLEEAEQAFQKALERAPDDVDVLVEALDAAMKAGRWDRAAVYAEHLMKIAPERQEGPLARAFLDEREGAADKAIALLSGLDPGMRAENPELFLALAELQVSNGRFDDFAQTIEAYKRSYPEHTSIFDYLAAREMLVKGQPAAAAAKLATVVESTPEFVRAQYYQAVAYMQSNQNELAQSALESYMRSRPDDERARALWETRFGGRRSHEEALNAARSLITNQEAGPFSRVFAARSLMSYASLPDAKDGDVEVVKSLLERAIQEQPAALSAYEALTEFLIDRKDTQGARQTLDRAAAAGVPKSDLAILRAAVALAEGDLDAADKIVAEDLTRPDVVPDEAIHWAELLAGAGYLEKGIETIKRIADRMNPDQQAELDLEQVTLTTRYGALDSAMDLLRTLEPEIARTPALAKRLNQEKVNIARALLRDTPSGEQERKKKAQELIDAVERIDPMNAGARVVRAGLLLQQDPPDYRGATSIITDILESAPSDVDALMLMSDITAAEGRTVQSLDYAQRAAADSSPGSQAQLALAEAQLRAQRYNEARETVQRFLVVRPANTRAMELLVRAYGEAGQVTEARAALERLEKAGAGDATKTQTVEWLHGWLSGYEGNWQEAERTLRAQYDAKPDDLTSVQALATALMKLNRNDEAEQLLEKYAERQHNRPEAWTILGQFYLGLQQTQDLTQASSAFTQALFLVPDYAPALRGLIEVQVRGNNRGTALSLCDRYLGVHPDEIDILYRKAVLLAQDSKRFDEALETISRAVRSSERPEFLSTRAAIYLAQGKYGDALKDLQRYAELNGSTTAGIDTAMAEIYLAFHETDLAKQYYESAKKKAAKAENADGSVSAAGLDATSARLERLGKKIEEESKGK
jgi:tetratricopeptide (TPR) repeat protein